jgi:hypothetical protein
MLVEGFEPLIIGLWVKYFTNVQLRHNWLYISLNKLKQDVINCE